MQTLEHQRVLVVGGSRGLGLGLTEALIARRANVTILAPRRTTQERAAPAHEADG